MGFYGFSVGLMAAPDVGVSPISSISYCMTFLFEGMTLGTAQLIVNSVMIFIQFLWLGKAFPVKYLLQLPASLVFSFVIDGAMPLVRVIMQLGEGLGFRIAVFLISLPVMALGLSLVLRADIVMLPGDALAKVLSQKAGWPFGRAKVWMDCICVLVTCGLSLVFLHRLVGIQIGTVIAALTLGRLVRLISSLWKAS